MQLRELQADRHYEWIFVVGSGRCGTTALAQILGTLPGVGYTPELKYFAYALSSRKRFEPYKSEEAIVRFFTHALGKIVKFNPRFKDREQDIIKEFSMNLGRNSLSGASCVEIYRTVFCYLVREFASDSTVARVILLTPANLFFSGLIHEILGPVKYIVLYRDSRNFFASAMKGNRRWHQKDITAIAHWNLSMKYGERLEAISPDHCRCIRQEDLLLHQDKVLGELMDFLAIEAREDACIDKPLRINSSFEQSPLSSANLDRYTCTMTPREIGKVEFLTSHYLQKYYPLNNLFVYRSSSDSVSSFRKAVLYGKYILEVSKLKGLLLLRTYGLTGAYFALKRFMAR